MKKIRMILMSMVMFMLCACGSVSYERDESAGVIKEVKFDQVEEMVEGDETVMILFTQSTCSNCLQHKKMLEEYLPKHNVTVYEFDFMHHSENQDENRNLFFDTIPEMIKEMTDEESEQFVGTPYTLIMQDGEFKEGISGAISEDDFDKLVVEYRLDEMK